MNPLYRFIGLVVLSAVIAAIFTAFHPKDGMPCRRDYFYLQFCIGLLVQTVIVLIGD